MQGIEQRTPPAGGVTDHRENPAVPRPVWKRSHIVWFLIALSLVPGGVAAAFREEWSTLPAGVRMTAYIVSGILIVVACTLMLREDPGPPAVPGDPNTAGDSP
ncbi:MAG TPA: hypothetical protein VJQ46_03770 [Gemmatimonadales bacterium]|nr:hypothetical protein [Gemmatimonadales bacterium]